MKIKHLQFKEMKKIRNFLLVMLFLVTSVTMSFAQVTLTYSTSGSNATVTGCTGSGEVVIPATVEIGGTTYNVTTIGANAFDGNTSITKLTFVEPSKVTTIDNFAFRDCSNLANNLATEPVLPSSLTTLNRQAFRNCTGLTGKLTIPTSLKNVGNGSHGGTNGYFFAGCTGITEVDFNTATYIGHEAFDGCTALTTVTLPETLQILGYNCFRGTGITSVVIPKSVTGFYQGAFMNCTSLESVEFEDGRTTAMNLQGQAFYGCTSLTSVTLVEKVNLNTGTSTTGNTSNFSGCTALESIVIPSSSTVIPNNTFFGCTSLQTVTISANTTMIGNNAFSGCTNLETVKYAEGQTEANFPSTLTSIGSYAFSDCEEIDAFNFDGCNPTIGSNAFENTGWYENVADNSIIYLNNQVIGYKGTITGAVTIEAGTTGIADKALENCTGITSIEFPASLTTIGKSAFLNTGLTSVTIPESVTTIGISAFKNCTSLATVNIGNTVTRIPAGVFMGTTSYHPAFTTITLPNSVTEIAASAFQYCDQLTSIDLSHVTTMGAKTFYNCTSLESYTLPTASSFTIPANTFYGCTSLTTIDIPSNITAIGDYVFQNCTGVTGQLVIPATVTSLGYSTFAGCTGLSSVKCENATPATAKSSSFNNIYDKILYVPAGAKDAYQVATGWNSFTNIMGYLSISIDGYGEGNAALSDHWRLIACPLVSTDPITPADVENLIATTADNYDLYRLNEGTAFQGSEWENYKAHTQDFVLENGKGYLYANQDDVELMFIGDFNTDTVKEVSLNYTSGGQVAGVNLVGNPFPVNAYSSRPYYIMNEDGDAVIATAISEAEPIAPCTGVIVKAEEDENDPTVTFTTTAPAEASNRGNINIVLSQQVDRGTATIDKAIVSFNDRDRLGKYVFNANNAKVYIPQNGKDYAIAVASRDNEMPVNFKATKDGEYTITVTPSQVEMGYLHLIDNLTGANVDLLQNPSYTFNALSDDYASRFRIIFRANQDIEESEANVDFAYFNGSEWVIANGENANVQIVDMMGRVIASHNAGNHFSTNGLAAGAYILRLVNGSDVKTQKIVVE